MAIVQTRVVAACQGRTPPETPLELSHADAAGEPQYAEGPRQNIAYAVFRRKQPTTDAAFPYFRLGLFPPSHAMSSNLSFQSQRTPSNAAQHIRPTNWSAAARWWRAPERAAFGNAQRRQQQRGARSAQALGTGAARACARSSSHAGARTNPADRHPSSDGTVPTNEQLRARYAKVAAQRAVRRSACERARGESSAQQRPHGRNQPRETSNRRGTNRHRNGEETNRTRPAAQRAGSA